MSKTPPPNPPPSPPPEAKKAGGNIKHDKLGNAVWDWNDAGDTTVAVLLKTAGDSLSLDETYDPAGKQSKQSAASQRSFNPYDDSKARPVSKLPPSPPRGVPDPKKGR